MDNICRDSSYSESQDKALFEGKIVSAFEVYNLSSLPQEFLKTRREHISFSASSDNQFFFQHFLVHRQLIK